MDPFVGTLMISCEKTSDHNASIIIGEDTLRCMKELNDKIKLGCGHCKAEIADPNPKNLRIEVFPSENAITIVEP